MPTGIEQMLRAEIRELKLKIAKHQRTILDQQETIAALNRQIAALGRVVDGKAGWQPIETAPQDGTEFIGYRDGRVGDAYRVQRDDCEMWYFRGTSASTRNIPSIKPTHWMPMPK